jgi:hypothetical protein
VRVEPPAVGERARSSRVASRRMPLCASRRRREIMGADAMGAA